MDFGFATYPVLDKVKIDQLSKLLYNIYKISNNQKIKLPYTNKQLLRIEIGSVMLSSIYFDSNHQPQINIERIILRLKEKFGLQYNIANLYSFNQFFDNKYNINKIYKKIINIPKSNQTPIDKILNKKRRRNDIDDKDDFNNNDNNNKKQKKEVIDIENEFGDLNDEDFINVMDFFDDEEKKDNNDNNNNKDEKKNNEQVVENNEEQKNPEEEEEEEEFPPIVIDRTNPPTHDENGRKIPVAKINENTELAWNFNLIANEKIKLGEKGKSFAFLKVGKAIRAHDEIITSGKQAQKIAGIGKKSAAMIDEWLERGRISYLDELRKPKVSL